MSKKLLFVSNFLIAITIILSFILVVYKDTTEYQNLSDANMENVISSANIDIATNIENIMAVPVTLSKAMSNDSFLISWLEENSSATESDGFEEEITNYLYTYWEKYEYSTVFFVSSQSNTYYYQDGINKIVSKDNDFDIWYYNFIDSGKEYDLQIDTNETDNNNLSIFVNARVEDDAGNLLGVIGVGDEIESIENIIQEYEDNYELSIYIINNGGSTNSFSGDTSTFIQEDDLSDLLNIDQDIPLNETEEATMNWYITSGKRLCVITQYNSDLDWYIIISMDTNSLSQTFKDNLLDNVGFVFISLAVCLTCTSIVFYLSSRKIYQKENIDELTTLFNKKIFMKMLRRSINSKRYPAKTIFMFDIDYFKQINDTKGHLYGNEVLEYIGNSITYYTTSKGMVSRWGGDEFLGYFTVDIDEAENILTEFLKSANTCDHKISLSIGLVPVNTNYSIEQLIKEADDALYLSKEQGKNRITVKKA